MNRLLALIVEDNPGERSSLKKRLEPDFMIIEAGSLNEAREALNSKLDVIISDVRLVDQDDKNIDGILLLEEVQQKYPYIPVILTTGYTQKDKAIDAMIKYGAAGFIGKPILQKELRAVIDRAIETFRIRREYIFLKERLKDLEPSEIIGESEKMREVKELIKKAASDGNVTVLIRGETGTGKGLAAKAIHDLSFRNDKPFVSIHCPAISESLYESELFGHEKGAFTGAIQRKPGKFEIADGGTIFLDEIADIPINLQAKILRVLQEREFETVGGTKPIKVDVQVIVATNRDMEKAVKEGKFREDLYYRINVFPIRMPNLYEIKEDIPLLAEYFLKRKRPEKNLSPQAVEVLKNYSWPGNSRELENAIERAALFAKEVILPEHLSRDILTGKPQMLNPNQKIGLIDNLPDEGISLYEERARIDVQFIELALKKTGGNKGEAWKLLRLNDRFALRRIIEGIIRDFPNLLTPYLTKEYAYLIKDKKDSN